MSIENEFLKFMSSDEEVDPKLNEKLINEITQDLSHFKFYTFTKFLFIQVLSALATLSVCPQFGIGPIGGGHGISHYFMQIGTWACASFCGLFFMGLSTSLAFLFLKRGEKIIVIRNQFWLIGLLSSVWMLSLMGLSELLEKSPMFNSSEFNSIWWLSAVLGSLLVIKLSSSKKIQVLKA